MIYKWRKSIFVFSLVIIGFFVFGNTTQAQEFQLFSADDISVDVVPRIPSPNQEVSLKLTSYSFNLNNYYIAWFENGERSSAGYGSREFKFKTGNSGDVTNITATIEFNNQVFRKELRFAPSQIDLLWEVNDAYAPPFYKGKKLPIQQSEIQVTAIPETLLVEPTDAPNLVYYWDRNYQRESSKSGFGKQSFNFIMDPLVEDEKITVTSNDRRENSFAKNTIDIPTDKYMPKILFYEINENNRLLTHKALNTFGTVEGDTLRFSFHPLYMSSVKENFTDMFVNWSVNNKVQAPQDFAKQNELYITSGGESGATQISVELEGIEKLLQKSQSNFKLVFNLK
jgi:hypothetical protein